MKQNGNDAFHQEICAAIETRNDWSLLGLDSSSRFHIAVMAEPFLSYIFDGKKTVESRFSLHRIAPYEKVRQRDTIFLKSGAIIGCFTVAWVRYFDLTSVAIEKLIAEYGGAICADDSFWKQKKQKRYVTLMGIENLQKLSPLWIDKSDRRGWIAL